MLSHYVKQLKEELTPPSPEETKERTRVETRGGASDAADRVNPSSPLHSLPPTNEEWLRFSLNERCTCFLRDTGPSWGLYASLGALPADTTTHESLFIHLMKANFLFQGTGGSLIGIDPKSKALTLSRSLLTNLSYVQFKEALEDYTNYVEVWREVIELWGEREVL